MATEQGWGVDTALPGPHPRPHCQLGLTPQPSVLRIWQPPPPPRSGALPWPRIPGALSRPPPPRRAGNALAPHPPPWALTWPCTPPGPALAPRPPGPCSGPVPPGPCRDPPTPQRGDCPGPAPLGPALAPRPSGPYPGPAPPGPVAVWSHSTKHGDLCVPAPSLPLWTPEFGIALCPDSGQNPSLLLLYPQSCVWGGLHLCWWASIHSILVGDFPSPHVFQGSPCWAVETRLPCFRAPLTCHL